MAEPLPDQGNCAGCGVAFGARHREGCPYEKPWPNDKVDHVQTRIAPVRSESDTQHLLDDHPLLRQRLEWEAAHPRPEQLRRAERTIVRALNANGFGRQYQVTRDTSFEIAVDDLIIRVEYDRRAGDQHSD